MSLENLVWGGDFQKEFSVHINGADHKIVFRVLNTEDTLAMKLSMLDKDNPDAKAMLADSIEMLSRAIVSIDGNFPDSPEETKNILLKKTQTPDIYKLLETFQLLSEEVSAEVKN